MEQDHDSGRINPSDGQEVVDYLEGRGPGAADPDDIGMSASQYLPGVYHGDFGDLRPTRTPPTSSTRTAAAFEESHDPGLASASSVWYSEYLRDAMAQR